MINCWPLIDWGNFFRVITLGIFWHQIFSQTWGQLIKFTKAKAKISKKKTSVRPINTKVYWIWALKVGIWPAYIIGISHQGRWRIKEVTEDEKINGARDEVESEKGNKDRYFFYLSLQQKMWRAASDKAFSKQSYH